MDLRKLISLAALYFKYFFRGKSRHETPIRESREPSVIEITVSLFREMFFLKMD